MPWLSLWCLLYLHILREWLRSFGLFRKRSQYRAHRTVHMPHATPAMRTRAKPEWARNEILHLAACDARAGCRRLADIFNRRHAGTDGTTIGKSTVANLLRERQHQVLLLRRNLRRRRYQAGRPNMVWGMDGTGKTDVAGTLHFLLGILDHGTRRCLTLQALKDKRSVMIVRALCDAVEHYGKPRAIRTDNEAIFQNPLFKTALNMLGIRHQTTDLHCPWQNGRIERFFGTLKCKLDAWAVADRASLNISLAIFKGWYNHVRPHQHLQGRTPAEVWNRIDIYRRRPRRHLWFEAWDGLLQGEYLQP